MEIERAVIATSLRHDAAGAVAPRVPGDLRTAVAAAPRVVVANTSVPDSVAGVAPEKADAQPRGAVPGHTMNPDGAIGAEIGRADAGLRVVVAACRSSVQHAATGDVPLRVAAQVANRAAISAVLDWVNATAPAAGTPGKDAPPPVASGAPVAVPVDFPSDCAELPVGGTPVAAGLTGRGCGVAPDRAAPSPALSQRLQPSPKWISNSQLSPKSPTAAAALRSFLVRIHVGLHL